MTTRRTFLTRSTFLAAATVTTPWRLSAEELSKLGLIAPPPRCGRSLSDPDFKALAQRAIDAATAAGASYADIRFTVTQRRSFPKLQEQRNIAVGIRALVQGEWGFMADTELTPAMMDWLGRSAARLAKASAWPEVSPITLSDRPPVASGHWETPVARDPWTIPTAEYQDVIAKIASTAVAHNAIATLQFNIRRQERTFASTDGAFTTQTIHTMFGEGGAGSSLLIVAKGASGRSGYYEVPVVSPRGGGFELFAQERLLERLPEWIELTRQNADAETLSVPGRFDVVFDGHAMATLVSSLGAALEVDRALGYEANSNVGGTSYLAPIEKVLGTTLFPTNVTITGTRTMAGGAATVRWDDEGIEAQAFPLVKTGQLINYATSREFVSEFAEGYRARGQTVQSRGCVGTESALSVPLVQTPNLDLAPGAADMSFEELVAGLDDGIAIMGGSLQTDQQHLNVLGGQDALIYAVKRGKFAGAIQDARYMARMPELWKNLVTLGGARSAVTRGFTVLKGEPIQHTTHSVRAVATRFKNVVVRSVDV